MPVIGWFLKSNTSLYLCRIKAYTLIKLLVTILIGITVGVLAVGLALGTEKMITSKNEIARHIIHDGRPLGVFRAALFHIGFSIGLVTMGSALVQALARIRLPSPHMMLYKAVGPLSPEI